MAARLLNFAARRVAATGVRPAAAAAARAAAVPARALAVRPITDFAYKTAKKVMPRISDTERAALNSGTVGFDGALFSGNPAGYLDRYKVPVLSAEEQAFMDNEVETLCKMLDDYKISVDMDLPAEVWAFIREKRFLGMIIPKQYGGLGFSPNGHSAVVQKIGTRSPSASVCVMVPNSLGPGELLNKYGTPAQKDYYLPRLASGHELPCFALTAPTSGSDAASMIDTGVVTMENGVLGMRATFAKRYITLAPVASIVGLAVTVRDPEGLLVRQGVREAKEGITIVLLPRAHPGLRIGARHDPLSAAFMNGTVEGENVFIPLDLVLGGPAKVGVGWNMLMECLSEGRGISLPAMSVAAAKLATTAVGGYARIRKQFKTSVGDLEGVKEPLARIAGQTFVVTAAQQLMNAMLNGHEKPAVLSGVMKQQCTDRMRKVMNDAMDTVGGAGICKGRANFLANGYQSIPIGITVEGANILTRSLIIYGQGVMRSHPHLLDLVHSLEAGNEKDKFVASLLGLVKHGVVNAAGSVSSGLLRSRSKGTSAASMEAYYESQLARLARNFAFMVDASLSLGGRLKFAEFTTGRFADVLSSLYLGHAMVWYHKQVRCEGSEVLLDYSMTSVLNEAQEAIKDLSDNFPIKPVGLAMRALTMPLGGSYGKPTDKQTSAVAKLITTDSAVRTLLKAGVFIHTADPTDRVALIDRTLADAVRADAILAECKKAKRAPTADEKKLIDAVEVARNEIIQVDAHAKLGIEVYQPNRVRPALLPLGGDADKVPAQRGAAARKA